MVNKENSITVNVKVEFITIPLEDYNELLIYKGRYLELSNMFDGQLSIQGVDPTMINPNLQFNIENETNSEEGDTCCEVEEDQCCTEETTNEDLSVSDDLLQVFGFQKD